MSCTIQNIASTVEQHLDTMRPGSADLNQCDLNH